MIRGRLSGLAGALAALALFAGPDRAQTPVPAATAGPFANWTALVVAGDWRAHEGGDTNAFDNGRRDIAQALERIGFSPASVLQYSLRPPRKGDAAGLVVPPTTAVKALIDRAKTATEGCLVYVTSHGGEDGAVFGPDLVLTPAMLKEMVRVACPARPVVAVVSACFSGVFVPPLAADDRLVMTAARRDRSSFGCGASDVHTYYDDCMLQGLSTAPDFAALPPVVRACVSAKEKATHSRPSSEPQAAIGKAFAAGAGAIPFVRP